MNIFLLFITSTKENLHRSIKIISIITVQWLHNIKTRTTGNQNIKIETKYKRTI